MVAPGISSCAQTSKKRAKVFSDFADKTNREGYQTEKRFTMALHGVSGNGGTAKVQNARADQHTEEMRSRQQAQAAKEAESRRPRGNVRSNNTDVMI
jgi:hypothetical protein